MIAERAKITKRATNTPASGVRMRLERGLVGIGFYLCSKDRAHKSFIVCVAGGKFTSYVAVMHGNDAARALLQFIEFGRYENDANAFLSQIFHNSVDFGLCPDINAFGWLIKNQNTRPGGHSTPNNSFLLVAT